MENSKDLAILKGRSLLSVAELQEKLYVFGYCLTRYGGKQKHKCYLGL